MKGGITLILTGDEIIKQIEIGSININPFDLNNLNPNSYNYRLGGNYIDLELNQTLPIPKTGLLLEAKKLYLFSTLEKIGSNKFTTSLIGRSSIGRLGIFLNVDADLGHIGTYHKWTLEIMAIQPVIIYPKMTIGQVSFWTPNGELSSYYGRYIKFNKPKRSIYDPKNL